MAPAKAKANSRPAARASPAAGAGSRRIATMGRTPGGHCANTCAWFGPAWPLPAQPVFFGTTWALATRNGRRVPAIVLMATHAGPELIYRRTGRRPRRRCGHATSRPPATGRRITQPGGRLNGTPAPEDGAEVELLRWHVRRWPNAMVTASLVTVFVAWAFGRELPDARLAAWAAIACALYAAAVAGCRWYESRADPGAPPRRWSQAMLAIAVGVGLAWGSLAWWMPDAAAPVQGLAALVACIALAGAASASGIAAVVVATLVPCALLVPTLLALRLHFGVAALATLLLLGVTVRYGLLMQRARLDAVRQRRRAELMGAALRRRRDRLRAAENRQVVLDERQRLLRELHDGVGQALRDALNRIECGQSPPADVAASLRDCIDDMRLVIDSLEPIGHDLTTLLGAWRVRIDGRLRAANVALEWAVDDLPPLPWLDAAQALLCLRIVHELVGNVLRHAGACRLRIAAAIDDAEGVPAAVRIDIADDGAGFDPAAAGPAAADGGLALARRRAQALGIELRIDSAPGAGTHARLLCPLQPGGHGDARARTPHRPA